MYTYNAIKRKAMPTQKQLDDAQRLADDDDDKTRDVRPLMSILMRLRRADPRLRGHILTRSTAVSSFGWSIIPADPNPTPLDIERADKARQRCSALIREVIKHRLQASLYDVMCIESEIDRAHPLGAVQVPKKRYRPVELEKLDDYSIQIFTPGEQKSTQIVLPVALGAPTDARASYTIATSDDDERGGLLRSIATHEILLWEMTTEWGNFNKKLKGIIQAIFSEGATAEEQAAAVSSVRQLAKENYAATSDLIEFKFNQMTQSGAAVSFKDMVESLKTDIALTLLGQANTAELPSSGGSRAALQVLNLIRSDIMYDDMIRTEECINMQVLLNDMRLNYEPTATEPAYRFAFSMPDGIDPETRARIATDAYNAGIRMITSEFYREIGMTAPPDSEDVIQKDTALP